MRKLLALLVVLAGAIPLFGQGTSFPVFNRQGWTMAGAVVSVCNGPADPGASAIPCTGLQSTTYVDWTLTTTCTNMGSVPNPPGPPLGPTHGTGCTNPGLTDSHGNATIFAANGFYWAQVAGYQVVPQSFPFDIGSGGGGGGLTPCGQPTDIQNYFTNIALGCDTGIGILDPSQHLISENHLNANQQVSVGNGTVNGLICQGHSNGTAIDAAYCTQPSATFSPTPTGGYGLFPPDNSPTSLNQAIGISNLTPVNVVTQYGTLPFYKTQWGSVAGAVSLEYLYPLDFTNAPSPTQSNDLIRTLFPQGISTAFMGPPPGSVAGPFVYQSNTCTGTGTTASCSFLGPSKPGHAYVAMVVPRQASTVGTPTDTAGNTFTALHGPGATPIVADAQNIIGGPIDTISQTLDTPVIWIEIIMEIGDVPPTSAIETSAHQIGGCTGSTLSFAPVTTTATDLIVGLNFVNSTPSGLAVYTAAPPYYIDQQLSLTTGGLTPLLTGMAMAGLVSAGTITPTATSTNCVAETETIAFKDGGFTDWAEPRFRYPTVPDWVVEGLVPDPTAAAGEGLLVNATGTGFVYGTVGAGSVTTFSAGTLSPLFTTTVATPTTTPALSFTLSSFSADNIFGNFTGGSAAPSTQAIPSCAADGSHALTYASHTLGCTAVGAAGSVPFSGITSATNTTAAMVVGAGSTLDYTSTGTIDSNKVNGATVGTSLGIAGTNSSGQIVAATVTHTCEIVWGGTGTASALQSGDDAVAQQSCLNTLGVTETITAVQCRSDNASNTTTVNPTFGSTGTGTTICSGALTCGNSGAYSSTCTVSNASLTSGSNINPVMGGTLTGTSIHLVVTATAAK